MKKCMVNREQKRKMIDFLVGRLQTVYPEARHESREVVEGGETNFILADNRSAVILVDRAYPNGSLTKVRKLFRKDGVNIATVFYKDGENFFRSATKKASPKVFFEGSLKDYNGDDVKRMLLLRPEEIKVQKMNLGNLIYYQPKSALDEVLFTIDVKPVKFDYSHINSAERFRPEDKNSKRTYIWDNETRRDIEGDLRFSGNALVSA